MENFKIIRNKKHFLIINLNGNKDLNGYITNKALINIKSKEANKEYLTCNKLINTIQNKKVPSNDYLLKCAIALTTDKEYKENLIEIQKRRRTKYINIQKGLKK
ncbi:MULTISPECIES: hypothetical protein [Clostridium]|uniref:DNA gyrase subunit A n=2 Tax=Clostridium TaxID=1485 RepID=A0A6M0T0I4_CLOBO|nr:MULTISPECIES: hypothetical protein [Clostridium]APF25101.1 putative dNA gyrase, A subunit [Clostridium sporogenes]APH15597.1 putative dNA gyrase, A subunit [Clostridium sporogenes]MBD5639892.1 DNA gyrase subunit A [Clostridium botulinum]MDI6919076.1 DNA gyrase subunit A [Clostridium botulinum]NFA61286.1 DNA gyrase subunit A [Clostridium botulinum]